MSKKIPEEKLKNIYSGRGAGQMAKYIQTLEIAINSGSAMPDNAIMHAGE